MAIEMVAQVSSRSELFRAVLAFIGFVTGVSPHMNGQVRFILKKSCTFHVIAVE